MQPAVIFKGIQKSFPGTKAVDFAEDEKIEIYPGEIHGLIGENGAGKSTLLQILMGIYSKDAGEIYLNGELFEPKNILDTEKHGVSIIMQAPNILPNLTVAENIFIGHDSEFSSGGVVQWKKQNQAAKEILDKLGYTDMKPTDLITDVTFEQSKQTEIARALSTNPKVLLVDETSAAVSRESVEKLYSLLRDLKKQGVAIIYISHFIDEVYELCDRISVLRDGKFIDSLPITEDLSPDKIIAKMVGREVTDEFREDDSMDGIGETLVSIKGLTKENVFEDMTLDIHRGEIVGVGGIGGCGSEEFGAALFGKERYDYGEIIYNGQPVTIHSPVKAVDLGIGYIPKDRDKEGLITKFSVEENNSSANLKSLTRFGCINFKKESEQAKAMVEEFRTKTPSIKTSVMSLSGGNRQKVAIAKWVVNNSEFLIINSPTRGVDVGAKFEIYRHIERLKKQGKAILLITDDLPELMGLSDNIYTMRKGKISASFRRDELFNDERLMKFMT